jgi:hypothetical protein
LGNLTGAGVIGANNSLDFKMLLKLTTGSGSLLGQLTNASAGGQTRGLPFLVQGTTQNPKFLPAVGDQIKELKQGLKSSLLQTAQGKDGKQPTKQDLKDALGGLFQKKK